MATVLTDIYLVQNFFTPQLETGRMDGGVSMLLVGTGDGQFEPVWPNRSGLVVAGDAMAAAVTDSNQDGWVDFLVSVNDGEMFAFENQRTKGNRMLRVQLAGKEGNPTAVGSRVTIRLDDGTQQTAEVQAGSGYLSQSTSVLFFGLGSKADLKSAEVVWPNGPERNIMDPPKMEF